MMIVPDTFSSLENFTLIGWRVAECQRSLLYIYIWGCCDAWHTAYRNSCLCWLWKTSQLQVLEASCNEMLYWIFPLKIQTQPTSGAFIKHPEIPPTLRCDPWCLLYGNQNWQTHRGVFAMSVWLTVHIKHTALSHFFFKNGTQPSERPVFPICSVSPRTSVNHQRRTTSEAVNWDEWMLIKV